MTVAVAQSKVLGAWSGSLGSAASAGDTLFYVVTAYSVSGAAISSSSPVYNGGSVTGAVKLKERQSSGANAVYTATWMLPDVAGSGTSVGITVSGADTPGDANTVGLTVYDVTGLGSSPSLDKSASSAATSTAVTSGASGSTTQSPEIVIGSLVIFGETMAVAGSPWTEPAQLSNHFCLSGYQLPGSSGTSYTYAKTAGGSAGWAGTVVTVAASSNVTLSGRAPLSGMAPAAVLAVPVTLSGSASMAAVHPAAALAAGPPPPGYPDGNLDARIELLLGGTWTDITTVALPDGQQNGSVKGGQPDGAQQPSAAQHNGTWDNPGYSLSPRNSAGPYFGQLRQNTPARLSFASPYGAYLRLEADDSDSASVADTAALHVTGSLELRIGVILSDWRGCVLAARRDGTTGSWHWLLNSDGTMTFLWWDSGGTTHSVTSPSAASVSWRAFKVTLGASNGNVQFFVSDSVAGTWTSMGAAASGTSGAATSVRAGDCPLTVGYASTLSGSQLLGQVYGFRMYGGITDGSVILDTAGDPVLDTAGDPVLDTTAPRLVADAAFSDQVPGVTSWADGAGLTWALGGGAEVTARDYRLYGEVPSLAPSADASGSLARVTAQLAGRLRRLQQGAAPAVDSAIKRAILSRAAAIGLVGYWTCEDGQVSKTFGAAVGSSLLTASLGKVQAAADSSFECSAPLPTLNADSLSFTADTYTGGTGWALRFLLKRGSTLPASGSVRLIEVNVTGGAVTKLQVVINADGTLNFNGFLSGGSAAWTEGAEETFPQAGLPGWWSIEATPSGSNAQYALVALEPGASTGNTDAHTVTGHGSYGTVAGGTVNPDLALDDTVFGHLSLQKTVDSLFNLGAPLNAWRTELAADRFARVCAEQGIPCRILGRPSNSQAMGPQPAGSAWAILKDCGQAEQGIIFEPTGVFGAGFRTRESIGAQQDAVTLDFSVSNLQGDLRPADDDSGFLNDVTGSDAGGTQFRAVLDDGSPNSVSAPEDGGRGRYAGRVPFTLNVADPSELPAAVSFYLRRVSVDEPRYRNVVMDLGIPGAPAADIARLRPGDKVAIVNVPGIYQDSDISQLAMGWTEAFGPGRKITWDCVPASPYS